MNEKTIVQREGEGMKQDNLSVVPDTSFQFYQTEDGKTRIQVKFEHENVWLSQRLMSDLFQKDIRTINEHIQNIYDEHELETDATIRKFRIVQQEGQRNVSRNIEFYNLDVIIAVGYRVKSHRGTQFRKWATTLLKEYIIKGFTMDDERLKQASSNTYFEQLLARIRDIRSSEKVFWRKVLDIYSTSVDYDPNTESSEEFFATVQNKMHWAAHGHTAAEIIDLRVNSNLPYMGLTSWTGSQPRKSDVGIAKNYLNQNELETLNRIVTAYLEFAELQALNRNPMYMKNWIEKLDDFLKLSQRNILTHFGKISHEDAILKAETEYEKYRKKTENELTEVDRHFLETVKKIEQNKPIVRQGLKKKKD